MDVLDFSECQKSIRHGRYGGQAGDKDGVVYNGENWIVKYPKTTQYMKGKDLPSYTTSPLSEYIGSHIYKALGYDVHDTILVYRNEKIAVACKDFQENFGDLAEIRTIKNSANKEIQECVGENIPLSATGDSVSLEELLLHFQVNPLMKRDDLIERFWDCVIVDILIDNNDRNNGNWGLLFNNKKGIYDIAPIYDNGNSFNNKISELVIKEHLNNLNDNYFTGTRTSYEYNGHILSSKKMLNFENENLNKALVRVVPKIEDKIDEIKEFIRNIPNTYKGLSVCSEDRKFFYIMALEIRMKELLLPAYQKAVQKQDQDGGNGGNIEMNIDDCEEELER